MLSRCLKSEFTKSVMHLTLEWKSTMLICESQEWTLTWQRYNWYPRQTAPLIIQKNLLIEKFSKYLVRKIFIENTGWVPWIRINYNQEEHGWSYKVLSNDTSHFSTQNFLLKIAFSSSETLISPKENKILSWYLCRRPSYRKTKIAHQQKGNKAIFHYFVRAFVNWRKKVYRQKHWKCYTGNLVT